MGSEPAECCPLTEALRAKHPVPAPGVPQSSLVAGQRGVTGPVLAACLTQVDQVVPVTDQQVAAALVILGEVEHLAVPPAAATPLAALLPSSPEGKSPLAVNLQSKTVGIILHGGYLDPTVIGRY